MKRVFIFQLMLVIGLLVYVGCGSDESNRFWYVDDEGIFHTQDLARAQEQVCFEISLPNYLPANLARDVTIVGPLLRGNCGDRTKITVTYQTPNQSYEGLVVIEESNYVVHAPDPSLNPGYLYFEIVGIEVVEHEQSMSIPGNGSIGHLPGYAFLWSQNGLSFDVGVYGYTHEQAVNILESMIPQGENTVSTPSPSQ